MSSRGIFVFYVCANDTANMPIDSTAAMESGYTPRKPKIPHAHSISPSSQDSIP